MVFDVTYGKAAYDKLPHSGLLGVAHPSAYNGLKTARGRCIHIFIYSGAIQSREREVVKGRGYDSAINSILCEGSSTNGWNCNTNNANVNYNNNKWNSNYVRPSFCEYMKICNIDLLSADTACDSFRHAGQLS